MSNIDDFRSSLELLLKDKEKKLVYYVDRINDYESRAKKAKEEIARLKKGLATKGE